jgi:hypothetical protein
MRRTNRKLMSYLAALMLVIYNLASVSSASAANYMDGEGERPTAGTMLADTVMVRPLMLVTTAAGVVAFVVTLPFSLA